MRFASDNLSLLDFLLPLSVLEKEERNEAEEDALVQQSPNYGPLCKEKAIQVQHFSWKDKRMQSSQELSLGS